VNLPAGTLTFLFTDLEGSTRLLHELGDSYGSVLEVHRSLIRRAVDAHGGIEFGTGGDALFVVFESPVGAVAAATAAQEALTAYAWPDGVTLRVRMALHTGEARVVDGDYVGMPLHVVARLCSAGHGGQVLVSETTRALVESAPVCALGSHRLRDVPAPIAVFQLGSGEFPPLRTLSSLPNNLPAASDRLVGRELELVEVAEALTDRRLVTLIGPGGAGKTRLALEVAASVLPQFADGVWFVALGAATTPDQIETLTAQALRIGERGGEPLGATLRAQLRFRALLLVVDNCEHLTAGVSVFVGSVLEQCPDVHVLATSRELLDVRGEQTIAVSALGDRDATRLFVERARAVVPGFDEGSEEPAAIGEICRRLDGLPLAIELSAARLRGGSLRQIADRLDDRFRLLGSQRSRTSRTLEAVVSWSYDLLDADEQAVFRRLAVFADSFDLADAEAIAGWGNIDPLETLDIVTRLVDTSMLVPLRLGDDYRYRMLETLRQYGREELDRSGERDECVAHFHGWARAWTARLEADMRTPRQDASLAASGVERENLRAVYESAEPDLALRIVTFAPIMRMRERRTAIDELLGKIEQVEPSLLGHVLTAQAQFAMATGLPWEGIDKARRAAEIFDKLGNRRLAAWARYFEMFAAWGVLDDEVLRTRLAPLVAEFRDLDEPLGLAYMLWVTSQLEPDARLADAQAGESEAMFREVGAAFGLAHGLEGRALIGLRLHEPRRSASYLAEAIPVLAESIEHGCLAHAIEAAASLMIDVDARADAALLLGAAEELRIRAGHTHRPWELRSRERAKELLAGDDIEAEQEAGRAMEVDALVAHALRLLEREATKTAPAR
jgi:predicted ATPase/class 3 adenylate cyclase